MSRRLAWVTGAGGLIGHQIVLAAPRHAPDWEVCALTRERLELSDFDAVSRAFEAQRPALLIHCAALSRSPACETDPGLATLSNVRVTEHLSRLAEGIPFFFLSTDLVFDGRRGHYAEGDPVNPLSVYAATKLAQEHLVRLAGEANGVDVRIFDSRAFLSAAVASPATYGFTNVTQTACDPARMAAATGGSALFCNASPASAFVAPIPNLNSIRTGASASTWLFADGVHPTTGGHRVLSDQIITQLKAYAWIPANL